MTTTSIYTVIQHLRRVVHLQDAAGKTDAQLLESFIDQKDEAAFAALVHRHGPMVLSVCRRILRNDHDAEDAFQVTFLVLASKAASIRPREMVSNWLHGVAYRTALKARARSAKRQVREKQVMALPEPEAPPQDHGHELKPLLDQELSRLPQRYRLPILLCALEGKSIREASQHLGWPQGTVAGRLARGKKMLAQRFARRGLVFSGGSVAVVLSQFRASAGVATSLRISTVKAATLLAAGKGATSGVISAQVVALLEGVMTSMMLTKFKMVTAVLLVLGMFAFGGGLLMRPIVAQLVAGEKPQADGRKSGGARETETQEKAPNAAKEQDKHRSQRASGASPVTPSYVVEPPDILLVEVIGLPQESDRMEDECLVRPDGTIALRACGAVDVAGRSLDQVCKAITDHLAARAGENAKVEVRVHVIGYNSKAIYVIARGKEGDQVWRFSDTRGETVVGAVLRVDGLAKRAVKGKVRLACPSGEMLEVDWQAITQQGKSNTNYLLRSGDRVIVEDSLVP